MIIRIPGPRGIKIQLETESQKRELFKNKKRPTNEDKFKNVTLRPDRTETEILDKKTVQQMYTLAKEQNENRTARMRGRNFELEGKLYKPDEIKKISVKEINPKAAAIRAHNWGISFQRTTPPTVHCEIKGKDGKTYN